ncbi:MAG: formyltetrahydrofolate deformylase [Planctomycetia bacterium]|nr:formyltetrahydrofolate deformylase [Planctomycetia bacterium]
MANAILRVRCQDRTGIIAALSDFVFRHGGNILDLDQHAEPETGRFFMRLTWSLDRFCLDRDGIRLGMEVFSRSLGLAWELDFSDRRDRVAIFCSKEGHCLYDLLLRQRLGELAGDVVVIVSNHPDLRPAADYFGLPFEVIPISSTTKEASEAAQNELLQRHGVNLVVMARYMQILSSSFVERWAGRVINIHHSFLPAFAGAKPYHQAHARGVKLIGATAHYATAELDEGPIIEQDVARVSHRDGVKDLVRLGRDLERQVLSRAVRYHLERRLLVEGNRTVVFG